ncbi:MAG: hypothetical protein HQ549_01410 [Candidatus Omnitrophica bacterium]|nr:hypothetical protein [Candidatus Omnitrophota bacterium]
MKKIIFFCLLIFFCAYSITSLRALESDFEKQASIAKAINEKPDLTGKDKHSIELMFGYPVFRKKIPLKESKKEEKKEIWIYRPFDYGEDQITITFIDGLVSDVKYEK